VEKQVNDESPSQSEDDESAGTVSTTTGTLEIEDDLLERAHNVYPAAATRTELFRRIFEKGVCARERELQDHESGEDY
jgi:hypothetical protein